MFRLDEALKVYLHREPIDFRLNINSRPPTPAKATRCCPCTGRYASPLTRGRVAGVWQGRVNAHKRDRDRIDTIDQDESIKLGQKRVAIRELGPTSGEVGGRMRQCRAPARCASTRSTPGGLSVGRRYLAIDRPA